MKRSGAWSGHAPPWWPEGEPWPPRKHWQGRHGPPRRFLWRAALIGAPVLLFIVIGATQVFGWVLQKAGVISAEPFAGWYPLVIAARVFLAAMVFLFVLRRFARPLGDLVGAADRVAEGDFKVRIRERGTPWMRSIGRAFNSMAARLEGQQRQRRELMADVAHELRTPLAIMQGRLEGMMDGVYPRDPAQVAQILDETRRLGRLVDDLRTLASSESGTLALQREPTDLAVLIEDAAASLRPDALRRQVTLSVRAGADLPLLDIDPVRIREVVTNLLTNALRYARDAGAVRIEARVEAVGGVAVAVSDDGPGIAAADLPHVFDRFYKERGSTGSGLGLAIAQHLVAAHGGTIAVRSVAAQGTTVTFTLPAG